MSDKVKLPKLAGSVLEDLINRGDLSSFAVLQEFVFGNQDHIVRARREVEDLHDPYSLIMEALINGYEVEQSPEDKVRDWYLGLQSQLDSGVNGHYREQLVRELTTIDKCIKLLNIKIEGVNI